MPDGASDDLPPLTLPQVLRQAGIDRHSVIRIAGSGGLAPLLWFCRHDYSEVGYVHGGPCPGDACDLLVMLNVEDIAGLPGALRRASHLRPGGVLVVQTAHRSHHGPTDVSGVLAACGYRFEQRLCGAHKDLHIARREPAVVQAMAA